LDREKSRLRNYFHVKSHLPVRNPALPGFKIVQSILTAQLEWLRIAIATTPVEGLGHEP
jgi:hypothetical protein